MEFGRTDSRMITSTRCKTKAKKKKKKTYSQKREKARASVPKKLKLRVSLLVETEKGGCFRVFKYFVSYHYIYKSG